MFTCCCWAFLTFSTIVPTRSIHPFSARPSSQTSHASPGPSQTSHPRPDTTSAPPVAGSGRVPREEPGRVPREEPGRVPPEEQPRGDTHAAEYVKDGNVRRRACGEQGDADQRLPDKRRLPDKGREQKRLPGRGTEHKHDDLRAVGRGVHRAAYRLRCRAAPPRRRTGRSSRTAASAP